MFNAGKPQRFDFGSHINWIKYGQVSSYLQGLSILIHTWWLESSFAQDRCNLMNNLSSILLTFTILFQSKPPSYNMSRVTAKTVLFSGYMDLFTDPKDVQTLADQLPNVILQEQVPFEKFSHQDFIMCIDARKHLYDRLIRVIKEFE